jgi:NAD+ synthetase
MKIALAQINPTVGDIASNLAKISAFAAQAKASNAELVIFPELAICGYPPLDLVLKESFVQANLQALHTLERVARDIAVLVGFVDINKGGGRPLFNACAYLQDGQVRARQYKTLLPTYDVFDEDRYFEPAKSEADCIFEGRRLGLSICEDLWNYPQGETQGRYRTDPIARLAAKKPAAIINISASPFVSGKSALRQELIAYHAKKHGIPIIFVNQVGGNDQLIFDGRSLVVDGQGTLVGRAKAFAEDLLVFDLPEAGQKILGTIADEIAEPAAEAYSALVLGTRDYVAKSGFKQAVIGLSGGIDSAVTAALAVEALGKGNVLGIAMPSPYSSKGSLADAQSLAENLGIELKVIPIDAGMQAFDSMLAEPFQGRHRDVTEENIQARLRGSILMALSNKFNYLVLTTGNKSELAVGYCTLYGDMCGGLAVISDIPKMLVYELAKFINARAGYDLIPKSTIEKPPSAELRENQRDDDTLPPYPVLDPILYAYVEQRLKPDEIVNLGFDAKTVSAVIERVDRNEYKRKQAAPGLKISPRAFGMGWRMPIAQGFKESTDSKKAPQSEVLC